MEIERFQIINPPILVEDPLGSIDRVVDDGGGKTHIRHLREDPVEAIRQSFIHTIKLVGKENANIVIGKVGNTVSTFYPDPDVEVTSVDGQAQRSGAPDAWATIRSGAGTSSSEDRKSTRLNSSHIQKSRMPSSA